MILYFYVSQFLPWMRKEHKRSMQYPVRAADAPSYMLYPGVSNFYRCGGNHLECFPTLFWLHTETFNLWSVITSFSFSLVASTTTAYFIHGAWPAFLAFFLASLVHSPCSFGLHLFMPISVETFRLWRKLDMLGIFAGSVCFTFALAYFVFPWWGVLLNTAITFILAVMASRKFLQIPDDLPLNDPSLTLFTFSVIISYWIPMIFTICSEGKNVSLAGICAILELMFLFLAGLSFTSNWPQKVYPGRFDIFGNSHHIMRICVMMAHADKFCFVYNLARRKA